MQLRILQAISSMDGTAMGGWVTKWMEGPRPTKDVNQEIEALEDDGYEFAHPGADSTGILVFTK